MPEISQITMPSGTTYDLKDAQARAQIGGAIIIRGTTTTALTDEATTNPITIDGSSYTAKTNDAVFYNKKEFVFDGTKWHEFGDMSGLGSLATKNSASGSYTPEGSVSTPTITVTPTTTNVPNVTSVGSMPTFTVQNETLIITAGAVPTLGTAIEVMTDAAATSSQLTFSGTAKNVTVS